MGNILQTLAEWRYRSRLEPVFAFRLTALISFVILVLVAIPLVALGWTAEESAPWYVYIIALGVCVVASLILGAFAYLSASYVQANIRMYQKQGLSKEKAFEQALADKRHQETQWTTVAAVGALHR